MQLPDAIWKRRLQSEYQEMKQSSIRFEVTQDLTQYTISLHGKGIAKEDGLIKPRFQHSVLIELKKEYPYAGGLEVYWLTPVFHPNIRATDGVVCIQLLNEWSAAQNLVSLVDGLKHLLENPNPQSPLNEEAARYFLENPQLTQHRPAGPRIVKL